MAREIIRKEKLRHEKVSVAGYLMKALRYGKPCSRCQDVMTNEPGDGDCPLCLGTGFESGFHPPVPLQCWDLSLQMITDAVDLNMKGPTVENPDVGARIIGFPSIQRGDIWISSTTDDRWLIKGVQVIAAMRGVPLVCNVRMGLIPYSDSFYDIPLEPAEEPEFEGKLGDGCVVVALDYLPDNALCYLDQNGDFIEGAIIKAFSKKDYDEAYPVKLEDTHIVASTITDVDGNWANTLNLDPGEYMLVYEKENVFGPDAVPLTVVDPCCEPECEAESSSSCEEFVAPETCPEKPTLNKYEDFWDI
jgi:hypothetical protein